MKIQLFPLVAALLSTGAATNPTIAAPANALSPDVRASLPPKSTSFLMQRLPIGDKGVSCLVHVWGAVRPNTPDSLNSYNPYLPSPFCVDIFEPRIDAKKQTKWHLLSSASYTDIAPPTNITSHWLHPLTKQGPILEIGSSNGAPGVSVQHAVFVWDKGWREQYAAPVPQMFWSGGEGGGLITVKFDDAPADSTAIKVIESAFGKVTSSTDYRWNGERFAPIKVLR